MAPQPCGKENSCTQTLCCVAVAGFFGGTVNSDHASNRRSGYLVSNKSKVDCIGRYFPNQVVVCWLCMHLPLQLKKSPSWVRMGFELFLVFDSGVSGSKENASSMAGFIYNQI